MRRFLIPEAIETSDMDCGPACLKALLEGFGIHASYGRLREACQTDVDGTSIDQIEIAAVELGLDATQVMVPLDHLLDRSSRSLPALLVVRQPNGAHHFVVAWCRHGSVVQMMDPAIGRRWTRTASLLNDVYVHTQAVPAAVWREWAASKSFLDPLRQRVRRTGANADELIKGGLSDAGASGLASLDAAVRMVNALIRTGAIRRGPVAARVIAKLIAAPDLIPVDYWSAAPDPKNVDNVLMRGAVLIEVRGRRTEPASARLSAELASALSEKPVRAALELIRAIRADGLIAPAVVTGSLALAAAGVVIQAFLLRGFFDLGRELTTSGQRMAAIAVLLVFIGGLFLLDVALAHSILRIARRLEGRFRVRFLHKIPRLADRYFQSRPVSDMAQRCHNIHQIRNAPELASIFLRSVFETVLTVAGIAWLYPEALWGAVAVAVAALVIPLAAQPALAERDLRVRSHSGALTRYYLDALLGLTAIRTHAAERAVRREQLTLLGEWARAGLALQRTAVLIEFAQLTTTLAISVWLVWTRLQQGGDAGGLLLLVYWVLNLPVLGEEAAAVMWQYPLYRSTALRLLEPLGAPEEPVAYGGSNQVVESGPAIRFDAVMVRAAGNAILEDISLEIPPGTHLAIVGPSGAGKSTLVGLLLGWHRPASGSLTVDGNPFNAEAMDQLRRQTAWIDPQVRLWNRSLYQNLDYGSGGSMRIEDVIDGADLGQVVQRLPEGLNTVLGEGGGLISGGEGQRVRAGRAMGRAQVRLVILDEPGRGLDRERRRAIIERARERWRDATLLCITHDIDHSLDFDRVLVIDKARIVEDGSPKELMSSPVSRYRQLMVANDTVRRRLWRGSEWRRLQLSKGKLVEQERTGVHAGHDL